MLTLGGGPGDEHPEWAERPDWPVREGDWRWALTIEFVSDAVGSAVDDAIGPVTGAREVAHFDRDGWELLAQFSPEQLMTAPGDAVGARASGDRRRGVAGPRSNPRYRDPSPGVVTLRYQAGPMSLTANRLSIRLALDTNLAVPGQDDTATAELRTLDAKGWISALAD